MQEETVIMSNYWTVFDARRVETGQTRPGIFSDHNGTLPRQYSLKCL